MNIIKFSVKQISLALFLSSLGLFAFAAHSYAYALIDLNPGKSTSSATTSVEVDVNTETEATVSVPVINVNRASVTAGATTEASVDMDSDDVRSSSDLQAFARSAIRADESLEAMNFTEKRVEVRYKETGRLLALVPVTFTITARAHAEGTVEVDYPWYAFMTVDKKNELETNLKIAVDNLLRTRAVGSVTAEGPAANKAFTASESADIAREMHQVLQTSFAGNTD